MEHQVQSDSLCEDAHSVSIRATVADCGGQSFEIDPIHVSIPWVMLVELGFGRRPAASLNWGKVEGKVVIRSKFCLYCYADC